MSNKHEELSGRKVLRTLKWSADYYWLIQGLGLRFSMRCTLCFMSSFPDKSHNRRFKVFVSEAGVLLVNT